MIDPYDPNELYAPVDQMTVENPIGNDRDYGDTECHFCGSDEQGGTRDGPVWLHFNDCPWLAAARMLSRDLSKHGVYVPDGSVALTCRTCGYMSMYDDHANLVTHPASPVTAEEHSSHRWDGGYPLLREVSMDWAVFTAPRGRVSFIAPPEDIAPPIE